MKTMILILFFFIFVFRNPQELKHGGNISQENKRFNQYVDAARVGQDGGDCLRSYPCHINTE